jgi:hypothetical protein
LFRIALILFFNSITYVKDIGHFLL